MFIRELISNSSDALEKRRHFELVAGNESGDDDQVPMQITITADSDANTLTIQDTGIGMSREDLIANLGTIARSGSKNFLQQLKDGDGPSGPSASNVIGQFGVGFYSYAPPPPAPARTRPLRRAPRAEPCAARAASSWSPTT